MTLGPVKVMGAGVVVMLCVEEVHTYGVMAYIVDAQIMPQLI